METARGSGTGVIALLGATAQAEDALPTRVRAILAPRGFAVEAADAAEFGLAGAPPEAACHALMADRTGRLAAEGWGPTSRLAPAAAVRGLRPVRP